MKLRDYQIRIAKDACEIFTRKNSMYFCYG